MSRFLGGYQYVVSLEFAALTSTPENIDEANPQLTTYFKMQASQVMQLKTHLLR